MLTFEMIRELERTEREAKKLQKLPADVMKDLQEYMRRKEKIADKTSTDIMELENVKNTIKRFFELREKKIIDMALTTARTGLPSEGLTSEEEKVFYQIVGSLKDYREFFFSELGKEPEKKEEKKEERVIYRVKKDIKEFVGPDMMKYRLVRGEIVNLPKPLNDLLLKEGVLEEIHE